MGGCKATLRYLEDLPLYETVKPYVLKRTPPTGVPRSNVRGVDCHGIDITDARGRDQEFDLAKHGFAFQKLKFSQPLDTEAGMTAYLKAVQSLVSQLPECEEVRVYEHKLRDSSVQRGDSQLAPYYRRPSSAVHIDQTPKAAEHRIRTHFPEDAERLLGKRYRFINVWRPLQDGPVLDCPLALCDSRTLSPEDLVECDLVYEHYEGEHYRVKFNKKHEWYFYSFQRDDEVTLILNYDTESDTRCAHVAFNHPQCPPGVTPRRSIEVRLVAFLTT